MACLRMYSCIFLKYLKFDKILRCRHFVQNVKQIQLLKPRKPCKHARYTTNCYKNIPDNHIRPAISKINFNQLYNQIFCCISYFTLVQLLY